MAGRPCGRVALSWRWIPCILALFSVVCLGAEPLVADFSEPAGREQVILGGRHSFSAESGAVIVRGSGFLFLRHATGPGVYRLRFSLHEPEGFTYHAGQIRFFVPDPAQPDKGGYALRWEPYGLFRLQPGQSFISGGPENPHRFVAGEIVEVSLTIRTDAQAVEVGKLDASGEVVPICRFRLAGRPTHGFFGVYNPKWHSDIHVYSCMFLPADAGAAP